MVYAKKEDDEYYEQQKMIEFGLIGLEGYTLVCDDVLVNFLDRKSTRLNSSHESTSRMPSSA